MLPNPMVDLAELVSVAVALQARCGEFNLPFCVIDGLAVQTWSEPRFTRDVDATIFVGFGGERQAIERQLTVYSPRIPDAIEFALLNRVLLIEDSQGCPIDLALGAMPYEREMIARSSFETIDPRQAAVRVCGASDLIILKTFAGRPQDWLDIRGTIIRNPRKLDWKLIQSELEILLSLKEELDSLDRLLQLRTNLGS